MEVAERKQKAEFVEPMLLTKTEQLPSGDAWHYEIKFDGYRCVAIKSNGKVRLYSRNGNDFTERYTSITKALSTLSDETTIDGEVVALDSDGRPSFNTLQNYSSAVAPLLFYIFDLLLLNGKNVMNEPLVKRRELLERQVLPRLDEPIRYSPEFKASLRDLIESVKVQGLEGLIAKRRDSKYEPGARSGSWQKMRISQGQEFVLGGYTPSPKNFDALVIGYYENGQLIYAARTRNGFTPASRAELFKKIKPFETEKCPFANLPEAKGGRWGAGLTATKMAECRWLKPSLVGQFEFVEWTTDHHLRHSRFMALRDDKKAKDVRRE